MEVKKPLSINHLFLKRSHPPKATLQLCCPNLKKKSTMGGLLTQKEYEEIIVKCIKATAATLLGARVEME